MVDSPNEYLRQHNFRPLYAAYQHGQQIRCSQRLNLVTMRFYQIWGLLPGEVAVVQPLIDIRLRKTHVEYSFAIEIKNHT